MENEMTFEKIKNRAVRYFGLENRFTVSIFQYCEKLKPTPTNISNLNTLLDSYINDDMRRMYDDCECK